jgi:hypothetical protein
MKLSLAFCLLFLVKKYDASSSFLPLCLTKADTAKSIESLAMSEKTVTRLRKSSVVRARAQFLSLTGGRKKSPKTAIKVALLEKEKTKKQEELHTSLEQKPAASGRSEMVYSVFSSVLYFLASKLLNRLDFKNPIILQVSRLIFGMYVISTQVILSMLKKCVEKEDDSTLLTLPSALAGLPLGAASSHRSAASPRLIIS